MAAESKPGSGQGSALAVLMTAAKHKPAHKPVAQKKSKRLPLPSTTTSTMKTTTAPVSLEAGLAALVACPLCGQTMPMARVGRHVDQGCRPAPPAPGDAAPRSGTVHDFFGGQDTSAPGYFVLAGSEPGAAGEGHLTATFQRVQPGPGYCPVPGGTFTWQRKAIRLLIAQEIAGRFHPQLAPAPTWQSATSYSNAQYLKSHLQVRPHPRGDTWGEG
jgi:hypothetical protein